MIRCEELFEILRKNYLTFFTGVPDSTFKGWMNFLASQHEKGLTNIIACSECEATAIASGYYLSTKRIGVVYMQNSGLGKCVNPLTSLCDREVYSIPVLLMIGWRGEPGHKDEPQHKKMGRITLPLLDTLEVPYEILPENITEAEETISRMRRLSENEKRPSAIIIKPGKLEEYSFASDLQRTHQLRREEAIREIVDSLDGTEAVISTTGKASRELFEYRILKGQSPRDFYTVGSMGCSPSIALAIALQKPEKKIIVLDGDGAALMQLGTMATIGNYSPKNLCHIILDNGSYESTGGQPTVSNTVDFEKVAIACGYKFAETVKTKVDLKNAMEKIKWDGGPKMLVVKVNKGSRENLGRPTTSPNDNKEEFIRHLES